MYIKFYDVFRYFNIPSIFFILLGGSRKFIFYTFSLQRSSRRSSVTTNFTTEEIKREKELERILESRLNDLKLSTKSVLTGLPTGQAILYYTGKLKIVPHFLLVKLLMLGFQPFSEFSNEAILLPLNLKYFANETTKLITPVETIKQFYFIVPPAFYKC